MTANFMNGINGSAYLLPAEGIAAIARTAVPGQKRSIGWERTQAVPEQGNLRHRSAKLAHIVGLMPGSPLLRPRQYVILRVARAEILRLLLVLLLLGHLRHAL